MISLYRKYRPKTFNEMVGQNHIKLTLQNELETDSFVHAYLFCGPRGLGKTTAARLMAKAVNCENRKKGQSEPCNKCTACMEMNESKALDVIEIDAASHTGVDNVRENIIENVRFVPHKAKYKVFIIDEVHMLSISAFNALLKTLEEPPEYALFILCTTEIHKVPETIISRCQRFDFKKVGANEMIKRLEKIVEAEKIKIDDEIFNIIAAKSDGCMRDAEKLLGQILSLGGDKITKDQVALILPSSEIGLIVDFVELLAKKQASQAIEFINNLVEGGVDVEVFIRQVIEFLRKLILIQTEAARSELLGLTKEIHKRAAGVIEYLSLARLAEIIGILLMAARELQNSEIAQLPLELAVIKICGEGRDEIKNVVKIKKQEVVEDNDQEKKENKSSINLEKIKNNWHKIIAESHKKNRDLMFIDGGMVWPYEADGGVLILGFKFDLHKDRFDKNGHAQKLAEAIKEITGQDILIKTKALKPSELAMLDIAREAQEAKDEKLSGIKVTEENILDQVLDSFGGEVVEE